MKIEYLKHVKTLNKCLQIKNKYQLKKRNVSLQKEATDIKCLTIDRRKYVYMFLSTSYVFVDSLFQDVDAINSEDGFKKYVDIKKKFELIIPEKWEQVNKAGADVLFIDPGQKTTTVGITVSPVKIKTLNEFGGIERVKDLLFEAEKKKDGYLDIKLLDEKITDNSSYYLFTYEVGNVRGRKVIVTSVTINESKLYIFNATYKCPKTSCDDDDNFFKNLDIFNKMSLSFKTMI